MAKSDLKLPGGEYALVADRIELFYARYPMGRIITELVSRSEREITFRALVYRTAEDEVPAATGWASEREGDGDVNAVACLENTETSAIGRALANLGFAAAARRPSAEEMWKAARARARIAAEESATRSEPPPEAAGDPALETLRRDVGELLESAALEGMRASRVASLRERVADPLLGAADLELVEQGLRDWLRRRVDRRLGGGAA
ncbi:MAG TPA: hypothetical protein VFY16_09550 [Gemmatimonadaceae bacterium]|nr:hypothetical protein [Gemmatimonadaceae bacterium]